MHGESHNIALGCVRCMFSLNVSYSPSPSLSPQQCLSCHSPYQISPPFLPPKTRRRRSGGLACERRGRRQLQTVVGGISPGANELGQRERKEREREREGESFKCSRDSRESNMVGESLAKNQS